MASWAVLPVNSDMNSEMWVSCLTGKIKLIYIVQTHNSLCSHLLCLNPQSWYVHNSHITCCFVLVWNLVLQTEGRVQNENTAFEILTDVTVKRSTFWEVAPCSLLEFYRHWRNCCIKGLAVVLMVRKAASRCLPCRWRQFSWTSFRKSLPDNTMLNARWHIS
jgi:hypothetical protein